MDSNPPGPEPSRAKNLRKIDNLVVGIAVAILCYMFLPLNGLVMKSSWGVATGRKASTQKPGIVLGIVRQSKCLPRLVKIPLL